jgi:hypothetical protein
MYQFKINSQEIAFLHYFFSLVRWSRAVLSVSGLIVCGRNTEIADNNFFKINFTEIEFGAICPFTRCPISVPVPACTLFREIFQSWAWGWLLHGTLQIQNPCLKHNGGYRTVLSSLIKHVKVSTTPGTLGKLTFKVFLYKPYTDFIVNSGYLEKILVFWKFRRFANK